MGKRFDWIMGRIGLSTILLNVLYFLVMKDHPVLDAREAISSSLLAGISYAILGISACYAIADRILFGVRGKK